MPYDDEKTGKHFDFVWEASPNDRVNGNGCPYLTGKAIWIGYNDLETTHPLLAFEWHPWRNGELKPTDVTHGKRLKVWWHLRYHDPELGDFDFEWEAWIADRAKGAGCPFLTGNAVWPGYNDLLSRYPVVASQFHPTKNGNVSPKEISFASNKTYWWYLPYDDADLGHFDFEWKAKVVNRTLLGAGCPYIGNDKVWKGYNDLLSCMPHIARDWHGTKNRRLSPDDVYKESTKKVWWKCY